MKKLKKHVKIEKLWKKSKNYKKLDKSWKSQKIQSNQPKPCRKHTFSRTNLHFQQASCIKQGQKGGQKVQKGGQLGQKGGKKGQKNTILKLFLEKRVKKGIF
jgi:hypothetical protein